MPGSRPAKGILIRYHGSLTDHHGLYRYDGLCLCELTEHFDDGCDDDYPNRHQLVRPDGSRDGLLHVRTASFTLVAETDPAAEPKE